jgi:hypothetical protein
VLSLKPQYRAAYKKKGHRITSDSHILYSHPDMSDGPDLTPESLSYQGVLSLKPQYRAAYKKKEVITMFKTKAKDQAKGLGKAKAAATPRVEEPPPPLDDDDDDDDEEDVLSGEEEAGSPVVSEDMKVSREAWIACDSSPSWVRVCVSFSPFILSACLPVSLPSP